MRDERQACVGGIVISFVGMQGVIHPTPVVCPHCKSARAKRMPRPGDYDEYQCPTSTCRTFRVDGTTQQLIDNGADPTKGHFVLRGGERYLQI
jgi:hypothetical protein